MRRRSRPDLQAAAMYHRPSSNRCPRPLSITSALCGAAAAITSSALVPSNLARMTSFGPPSRSWDSKWRASSQHLITCSQPDVSPAGSSGFTRRSGPEVSVGVVDPQTLFATLATSTAALVAITGGLLVSRLVGLLSERESLQRRRQQTASERRIKEERADLLDDSRRDERLADWDRDHLREVIELEGDFDELSKALFFDEVHDDELKSHARTRCDQAKQALGAIRERYPTSAPPTEVTELEAAGLVVPSGATDVFERAAAKVAQENRPSPSVFGKLVSDMAFVSPITSDATVQRWTQRNRDIDALRSEVTLLQAEEALLNTAISALRPTADVWVPLVALVLFALTGVVFPVIRLALWPNGGSFAVRMTAVALFLCGFATLLGSIVYAARRLNRRSQRVSKVTSKTSRLSALWRKS